MDLHRVHALLPGFRHPGLTVIIPILGGIALIVLFVFEIMGIVRALKGSGKPLPFIEKLPVIIK